MAEPLHHLSHSGLGRHCKGSSACQNITKLSVQEQADGTMSVSRLLAHGWHMIGRQKLLKATASEG